MPANSNQTQAYLNLFLHTTQIDHNKDHTKLCEYLTLGEEGLAKKQEEKKEDSKEIVQEKSVDKKEGDSKD